MNINGHTYTSTTVDGHKTLSCDEQPVSIDADLTGTPLTTAIQGTMKSQFDIDLTWAEAGKIGAMVAWGAQ